MFKLYLLKVISYLFLADFRQATLACLKMTSGTNNSIFGKANSSKVNNFNNPTYSDSESRLRSRSRSPINDRSF